MFCIKKLDRVAIQETSYELISIALVIGVPHYETDNVMLSQLLKLSYSWRKFNCKQCLQTDQLLSFVYFFGQVACQCS